ncbi:MAG: SpoIIE family protein phosphatase [Spirochaetia bacterium]|nr:SpoIIE family protein phosphatase [Spirochaetia bacterium]
MLKLNDYKIKDIIYESDRSVIYSAIRNSDAQPIIVKALANGYPSPEEIARFKGEFEIMRDIHLDGVVQVYTFEKHEHTFIMTMEDYGGIALKKIMHSTKMKVRDFLILAVRLAEILGDLHKVGVIHKDINPGNILWNPRNNEIKLIDFGISTRLSRENQNIRNPDFIEGTLSYISPEQTGRMNRSIDYRTDFYSLGVTFYEALAGILPFTASDSMELAHCHIARIPRSLSELSADLSGTSSIPKVLSDIVGKLMAKSPEERYQNAYSLKRDLQKALDIYNDTGTIAGFQTGMDDISDIFQIPEKLYGIEKQIARFLAAFESMGNGAAQIAMVSGESGAGKSALVNEVYRFIAPGAGYFIRGKYQRADNNVPYSGLNYALKDLAGQLLQEPNDDIIRWKSEINSTLFPNGKIITDLIPEMESIMGRQGELDELGPGESYNRFLFTFKNFIKIFSKRGYPLVMLLDDLQWCDIASLKLMEDLLLSDDIDRLFLIGAYRANEVDAGHPLMFFLNRIQKIKTIHMLGIEPLSKLSVNEMVSDTLKCNLNRSEPLADLLYAKTNGNPFFIRELLKNFYSTQSIYFDHEHRMWDWKINEIAKINVSENVVELLNHRLKKLDVKTIELISFASCLGSIFDFTTLKTISGQSISILAAAIWEAIQEGVIIPLTGNFRMLHSGVSEEIIGKLEIQYQFQHDRIRQAASNFIEVEKRRELYLRIGRLLLAGIDPENQQEKLVEMIHYLNEGVSLIKEKTELERLKWLNLLASEKAKASGAFIPALQYISLSAQWVDESSWEKDYDLSFKINRLYAECLYLCEQAEEADRVCDALTVRSRNRYEKASIKEMQAIYYNYLWRTDHSIDAGIKGLKCLGIHISRHPSMISVLGALIKVKWALQGKKIDDLANNPAIDKPEINLALKLLINFIPPAYMSGNANLFALTVLKKTWLAIKYGNSDETAAAYTGYAVLLAGLGDLKGADEFGKLGMKLANANIRQEWKSMIFTLFALFSVSWNKSWSHLNGLFTKAVEIGLSSGDMLYTAFAAGFLNLWDPVMDLKTKIEEGENLLALIEKTKIETGLSVASLNHQKNMNFRGSTNEKFSMNNDLFNEMTCVERMRETKYESGIAIYHLNKIQIYYMYDDYDGAIVHIKKSVKLKNSLLGSPYMVDFCLYAFLAYAAITPSLNYFEKKYAMRKLKKEYGRMKKWANHFSQNFSHYCFLMEAELARISGNNFAAVNLYSKAIEAAMENEFPVAIALCNEIAARFYIAHLNYKVGVMYLRTALDYYKSMGYLAKIKHLEDKFRDLPYFADEKENLTLHSIGSISENSQETSRIPFDMTTLMKAATAISGEILLDRLLERLMNITIENAGAQCGSLFLYRDAMLCLVVTGCVGSETRIMDWVDLETMEGFPKSVVRFTARTNEFVVVGNAVSDNRFSGDPHIQDHLVKSLLCIPILNLGKAIGVLYLENNLVANCFTSQRVALLQVLSGHIAVSINNAVLYSNLDQKVRERTRELESRNQAMEHDIALARKIQNGLIPVQPPVHFISTLYKPMHDVGGDFFDFITFEDSPNIGIFVSDVSGHGVTAAFITSMIKTIILQAQEKLYDPASLLFYLNSILINQIGRNFITSFYGIFNPENKSIIYSNAGHNPPYIITEEDVTQMDRAKSVPIGVLSNEVLAEINKSYENFEEIIPVGSKILLYTDGLSEATSGRNDIMFEDVRMIEIFRENIRHSPEKFISSLFADLVVFRGSEKFDDDICLVCVGVN